MTIKEIRQNAFNGYKKHRLNSWILGIIAGLFIGALCLTGIVSAFLFYILVPFIVLPFFFSMAMNHLALREKDELRFSNIFGFFGLYYRSPFSSSFAFFISFLKAFIIDLIVSIIATGVSYYIFSQSETFVATMNQLIETMSLNGYSSEEITMALEANGGELGRFFDLTNAISYIALALPFMFFVCKEEITIYLRVNLRNVPLANQISRQCIKMNSKKYNKLYFALNWPLLVIWLVGTVGGMLLSIFAFDNYAISGVIGIAMSLALSSVFLPFYFANMEAIFEELAIDLNNARNQYVDNIFTTKQNGETVDGTKKGSDDTEPK